MRRLLVLVALFSCSRDDRPRASKLDSEAPARVVLLDGSVMVTMQVELADTARKVERGLAGRQQLAADTGMLFFMGRAKDWAFWMQETSISLDIIFITPDLRVAGIVHGAAPGTSIKHRIGAMSLYVLEVNAGWAAGHGITKGATVQFENVRL